MKNRVLWFGNGHVFPNFGLEMDEKSGVFDAPKWGTPHGECINTVLMRLTMRGDLCVGGSPCVAGATCCSG